MSAIVVRKAGPDDAEWILGELPAFSDFFGTKRPLFEDIPHVTKLLLHVLEKHVAFIAERGTERLGFIIGVAQPHPFNPGVQTLSEQLWWVPEQHRRTRAGLLLLNAFVAWGEANVEWISFGIEAKSPVRSESLEKRGFRLQERVFLKETR